MSPQTVGEPSQWPSIQTTCVNPLLSSLRYGSNIALLGHTHSVGRRDLTVHTSLMVLVYSLASCFNSSIEMLQDFWWWEVINAYQAYLVSPESPHVSTSRPPGLLRLWLGPPTQMPRWESDLGLYRLLSGKYRKSCLHYGGLISAYDLSLHYVHNRQAYDKSI